MMIRAITRNIGIHLLPIRSYRCLYQIVTIVACRPVILYHEESHAIVLPIQNCTIFGIPDISFNLYLSVNIAKFKEYHGFLYEQKCIFPHELAHTYVIHPPQSN